MAKSMAKIENGIVVNVIWCSDSTSESEVLKDTMNRPVAVGDNYENGSFYRNGAEVLTSLEEALRKNEEYEEALRIMGVVV